jgi:serine phosphatase RsbU (regulator of sigma subunit)/anti-sigma regulatory factor (Ser/Thr protein kinase)
MTFPTPPVWAADPAVRRALDVATLALGATSSDLSSDLSSDRGTGLGHDPVRGAPGCLSVPVPLPGAEHLRLVVTGAADRRFTAADAELAGAVAEVVAALLGRGRRERVEALVSGFGRISLTMRDVQALLAGAIRTLADMLATPRGLVTRRSDLPGVVVVEFIHGPVEVLAGEEYAEDELARAAGAPVCLSLDLLVGGTVWGRLQLLDPSPRTFAPPLLEAARTVAGILSATLQREANARRLRDTARVLQQALLPAQLPAIPGIETAARYLPAQGDRVGGDWYDVLELPHGAVGLVMGDVEGHDVTAAALMGQIRNVVRAYATDGHPPAEVMNRANRFLGQHTDRLATCCYLELHPSELTVTGVSAGHPWPLSVTPGGEVPPALTPGPPLGLDDATHYEEQTWILPAGATLLLVTDGLVAMAGDGTTPGTRALATTVRDLTGGSAEFLADALIARSPDAAPPRDDAALLVVRVLPDRDGAPPPPTDAPQGRQARRVFRPTPESVPAARRFARDILGGWDLAELAELADRALLAVSELMTNAVIHTASPILLTLRLVGGETLRIGVHDESDRFVTPRLAAEDDISGRGLAIVEMLSDDWGVEIAPGRSGKTVWCELGAKVPQA